MSVTGSLTDIFLSVGSNARGIQDFFPTGVDSCGVGDVGKGAFSAFSREAPLKLGLRERATYNVVCEYFPLLSEMCGQFGMIWDYPSLNIKLWC